MSFQIQVRLINYETSTLISIASSAAASFIHQCSSKYPEVNRCLMKAIADIKPHLPRGIPEMHIPPLEPMKITETSLSSGESLVANFKNVEIKKISDFALDEVDFDVGRNTAAIKIRFPVLEFYSDYRIVGKILVLQLDGTGKSYGNASKCFFFLFVLCESVLPFVFR